MTRTMCFLVAVGAAAVVTAGASASLVTNGDFEMPQVTPTFQTVNAGDTTITGWTVADTSVDLVTLALGSGYANTGRQSIDLAGTPGPGTISQDIATTPGERYILRFFVSSNGEPIVDGMTVFWDGVEVATLSTPNLGTWNEVTYELDAVDAVSTLSFRGNIGGFTGSLIDTVSVNLVPSPGAAALLVGVMGLGRRRRA